MLATFMFSEHGLPLTITDAHGHTVFLNYDDAAQPNGVGVMYGYDSLDRVMSMEWKKGTSVITSKAAIRDRVKTGHTRSDRDRII